MKQQLEVRPPCPSPAIAVPLAGAFVLVSICAGLPLAGGCRSKPRPAVKTHESLPLQTFARQWATDLKSDKDPLRQLHVRADSIYAYTAGGRVYSLARDSGSVEYTRPIKGGGTLLHAPVVINDKITFSIPRREIGIKAQQQVARPGLKPTGPMPPEAPPRDEYVVTPVIFPTATTMEVLEQKTGRFITAAEMKFTIRGDAVGRAGMLYLGGAYKGGSRAAAVDVRQPYVPVRWELMTPEGPVSAAPALWEDAVYFASEGGNVYAVTAANRDPIWPLPGSVFKTGAGIFADLAIDADSVYVASTDNKLYALNRNSGKIRWQYFGGAALRTAPAVTSDTVYQFVPGTGVVAIDKAAGEFIRKPRWVASDATQFLAADERNAYLRTRDNRIVAQDKKTGERKFSSVHHDFTVFATNLVKEDGIVYAGTKQGRVVAVRPVLKPGTVGEVVMVEQ